MPRKEYACTECDNAFIIKYDGGDPPLVCPFCGAELCTDDSNEFEDD